MSTRKKRSVINLNKHDKDYVYTIDEKMGQTYIHHECANTIAQRDYKQPQAVVVRKERDDEDKEGSE